MKSCSSSAEVSAPGSVRFPAAYLFFLLFPLAKYFFQGFQ